ncbi:MAG TPA: alkaline phosphatase family protein [Vicinamibacterales bacterium]|nr:alkaline phosphatase family protein [Vicinamibacterales bacterium]
MVRAALLLTVLLGAACASSSKPAPAQQPPPAADVRTPGTPRPARLAWLDMFARGYFPGRSGQVFVVPKEGWFVTTPDPLYKFMHGSPWRYDTHIPVLFYGAPFVRASTQGHAEQQDVAPTVGALIGAPSIPTYTGRVLTDAIAGSAKPRIVTVFVLDSMRSDYFDKYASVMPTLSRMKKEGAWFSDGQTQVLPTVTGVGHANIGTGSDPRFHGIVVNNLFNRSTGKPQEAYDQLDTRELMALTLADTWNLATDGKAVIIGHGGAIRATAGLVGRGACLIGGKRILAASYGGADGGWETNPACYTMPEVLKGFSGRKVWEAAGGTWMGHDIASAQKFRASSLFQKYEAEALLAVVDSTTAGADDIADLIFVNMKGPDYTSHAHGPDSPEMPVTLAELDRQIAAYLALMDKKAGPGRHVTAITADHGQPGVPPAGGRVYLEDVIAQLNKRFAAAVPFINYYNDAANNQLHLDTAKLQAAGISLSDVAAFLEGLEAFEAAYTEDEVRAAQARLRK